MTMIDRRSILLGLSAAPFLTRGALSEASSTGSL